MLDNIASRYANGVVVRTASSAEAFQVARTRTAAEGMICVTGSLYLIGELRPLVLSMSPAKGGHGRSPATILLDRCGIPAECFVAASCVKETT
jgi:hypothetical protein